MVRRLTGIAGHRPVHVAELGVLVEGRPDERGVVDIGLGQATRQLYGDARRAELIQERDDSVPNGR